MRVWASQWKQHRSWSQADTGPSPCFPSCVTAWLSLREDGGTPSSWLFIPPPSTSVAINVPVAGAKSSRRHLLAGFLPPPQLNRPSRALGAELMGQEPEARTELAFWGLIAHALPCTCPGPLRWERRRVELLHGVAHPSIPAPGTGSD